MGERGGRLCLNFVSAFGPLRIVKKSALEEPAGVRVQFGRGMLKCQLGVRSASEWPAPSLVGSGASHSCKRSRFPCFASPNGAAPKLHHDISAPLPSPQSCFVCTFGDHVMSVDAHWSTAVFITSVNRQNVCEKSDSCRSGSVAPPACGIACKPR